MKINKLQWNIATWVNQKIIMSGKASCRIIYIDGFHLYNIQKHTQTE